MVALDELHIEYMWWRRYFPVEIKKDKQWWSDVEKEKRKSLSYKEIYSNKYNFPVLKICEQKRDWLMNGKYKYSLSIVHKILKRETAGNQEFVIKHSTVLARLIRRRRSYYRKSGLFSLEISRFVRERNECIEERKKRKRRKRRIERDSDGMIQEETCDDLIACFTCTIY